MFLTLHSPDDHLQTPRSFPHVLWKLQHMEQSTPSSSSMYNTYIEDPPYPLMLRLFSMSTPLVLRVVFKPAASASNENLLEMQIHWPHPSPTGSETLGVRPSKGRVKEPQVILIHLKLETTHLPSTQAFTWLVSGTTPAKSWTEAFWPLITIHDYYTFPFSQPLVLCFLVSSQSLNPSFFFFFPLQPGPHGQPIKLYSHEYPQFPQLFNFWPQLSCQCHTLNQSNWLFL